MTDKSQRIRDPLHDIIDFNCELTERLCWQIIQTQEFQRLRRIKQLGFSDHVYPGASHTRFAHSLGVFHIARKLLNILQRDFPKEYNNTKAQHTLVAALLHDIGHGPFSHAFENFLAACNFEEKEYGHEQKSIRIIKETEVGEILRRGFSSGSCPDDIAAILDSEAAVADYHDAIVSSLFDADRLDYMQRDRLMTGTQLGGIDFSWLLANLTFGEVSVGTDDQETSTHKTFVLNAKAIPAAESYLLALFQLYPTVYFHKTTRCFEVLYTQLLKKLHQLTHNNSVRRTNLPGSHPLITFMKKPKDLQKFLQLDDSVVVGSLPVLVQSPDSTVHFCANRILNRKPLKCIDILKQVLWQMPVGTINDDKVTIAATRAQEKIQNLADEKNLNKDLPDIFIDKGIRYPYRKPNAKKGIATQIFVRTNANVISDIDSHSTIISAIKPFSFFRVYVKAEDEMIQEAILNIIKTELDALK